jgi:hypothetical protein
MIDIEIKKKFIARNINSKENNNINKFLCIINKPKIPIKNKINPILNKSNKSNIKKLDKFKFL